ncbi:cadherin domain-containing protein [Sphingomonas sp.]|uniref:cadherin domain-containing protein n=1 Tax=Sphingomonas sp. TaxID=28214 RepID=UPI002DD6BA66|nr:cadherin domain-containing protein [Sphingomonas sp.]
MTKRISQVNTVVVPVAEAHVADGKAVATKVVVVPAEADAVVVKVEEAEEVVSTVIAEPVAALVAPAPMAMVAEPMASAEPAAATSAAVQGDDDGADLTPFIVGGVLLGGGILAVALSSGDTDPIATTPTPTNTAPRFTSTATATIAENAPVATIVYDANVSDTENNTIVFTIGGADASFFNIDAATGVVTLKASANFEAKASYAITITATDNGTPSMSATQAVTVTVTNVNEAPAITSAATATVNENIATAVVAYKVTATDPDANTTLTYSIGGADAAAFNIDAATGDVTFKASPNFEAKSSYAITVTASDGTLSATQAVTITVANVNETPTITSAATAVVDENIATTVVAYRVTATDPDANTTLTYSIGGADAAAFNIDAATGNVTFKASPDFEAKSSYAITVTASDGALSATQAVTITVRDLPEGPVFTSGGTATIAENSVTSTVVYDANATGATSFALSGTDAAAFNFDTATGVVTFKASPDFEAKAAYNITISATNAQGTTTQAVVVNVTNVNETPVFAAATRTTTVNENVVAGTTVIAVAAVGASDPDGTAAPNTLTYSLTGADAAAFAVNATTGQVTFVGSPNFEAKASYSFNLVVTDQGGLTATQANTVNITNLNEVPAFSTATRTVAIDENVAAGTIVVAAAAVGATDPDAAGTPFGTLAYTLTGTDAAAFAINATTGQVTIVGSPDFETKATYSFNIVATDGGGLAATQAVTLNINDIAVEGVRIDGPGIPAATNTNFDAANGSVVYLESGAVGNITTIANFTSGDIIRTDVATSNYSFSSIGADLVISALINGVNSQITLVGAAGNNFIFNEATAEAAVGFDFFQSTAAPPPAQANTLAGNNTYNAASAAVTYTDDANAPNISVINNFTSDDRIVAINTPGNSDTTRYSFSSQGSDLVISFLSNGISSQITITGVVSANAFIFDEASAEQAVGFDFFRYG